jgi:hypothetical protein
MDSWNHISLQLSPPLTNDLLAALTPPIEVEDGENPHLEVADVKEDIREIGYPL